MWKATYKSTSTATEPSGKNHMQNIKRKGGVLGILARKFTSILFSFAYNGFSYYFTFTLIPIETEMLARFIIGAILVIIGLGIFLFGAEIGIVPIGNLMGNHCKNK